MNMNELKLIYKNVNKMRLIDTHCHLNFKDFREDADEVIKKTLQEGVEMMIVGSQYSTSQRAIDYAEKYEEGVWAVVGINPVHLFNSAGGDEEDFPKKVSLEKFDYGKYLELAKNEKVVAIGEVGLDYHHFSGDDKNEVAGIIELQKNVFREFVRLADEVGKPLVIHGWNADKRDKELVGGAVAYEDILKIVSSYQSTVRGKSSYQSAVSGWQFPTSSSASRDKNDSSNNLRENDKACERSSDNRVLKGVVHSFIGNYKIALRFIEEGFMIGLNGIITYSESYDRLIKEIGLENIILETDAPYLTPNPLKRYSRNEPLNVKLVAQKVADVLEMSVEKVAEITTKNARELFGIR